MMQVVSMEEVPMMFGSCSFQSNDVSGAQNSVFLLLFSSASYTRLRFPITKKTEYDIFC